MRQLSAMQEQRLLAMRFPLPPWHHNMRNAACQFLNSARNMPRAGRAAGRATRASVGVSGALWQIAEVCIAESARHHLGVRFRLVE